MNQSQYDDMIAADRERYRKCMAQCTASHMSNTKWRRVFMAIADEGVEQIHSHWKHIDSDHISIHYRMPQPHDLNEKRFNDGAFQPYEYKWIEWIQIPHSVFDNYHKLTYRQELASLETALVKSRANYISNGDGITIVAYNR
ncbi:hypothetical protein Q31b_58370 [Novipirellula aureliae]|uniref:Uncharacterized protein n=1 Tax=Novipirellula aureliae TaxID=2527966 RepID=A0A5C6D9Q7_9BACT|nr:hypothetical protein [Novipirellula aureliae]TWU32437.1 hypothetical protein Q31b_58370 [Novipirellula aureliae]